MKVINPKSRIQGKLTNLLTLFGMNSDLRVLKKEIGKTRRPKINSKNQILIETQQPAGNQVGLALVIPEMMNFFNAQAHGYTMLPSGKLTNLKEWLRHRYSLLPIYGAVGHIFVGSETGMERFSDLAAKLVRDNSDPFLFEAIEFGGVRIGDLIYDVYLGRRKKETIDFSDKCLEDITSELLQYTCFWLKYFEENPISAVCVSHCVYQFAIPARIALVNNIPAFQVTGEEIYRLSKEFPFAYTDFKNYKENFEQLSEDEKSKGKIEAQKRLDRRFNGEIGVDMPYSTKSAFSHQLSASSSQRTQAGSKIKIFIAVHDFYDSPHAYGDNFYPDFYIWLDTLGRLSSKTDYEWYIKTHPDIIGNGAEVIRKLIIRYPKFILLNPETTHQDIVQMGITLVLTVFGTVAMEYPAMGIPTINASLNNPHVSFNFSHTPKTREEYETLILNLDTFSYEIDQEEVKAYYSMHHIYRLQNWIYVDDEKFVQSVGGYGGIISTEVYRYFAMGDNQYPIEKRRIALVKFLNSPDNRLDRKHFWTIKNM